MDIMFFLCKILLGVLATFVVDDAPSDDVSDCMSIPQLGEAVRAAGWNTGSGQSMVMLTSCDHKVKAGTTRLPIMLKFSRGWV